MQSEPNLTLHKPLTGEKSKTVQPNRQTVIPEMTIAGPLPATPPNRFHVHGSAFMPGERLRWLFDFSITVEALDDAAAQVRAFDVFTEYDIDLSEIEEAPECD